MKLARTARRLCGAARTGARLMITGERANARVHLMRAHADAIMVGIGTVLADDPQLDRAAAGSWRIARRFGSCSTPICGCRLQRTSSRQPASVPTWVVATRDAPVEARTPALAERGAEVLRVDAR